MSKNQVVSALMLTALASGALALTAPASFAQSRAMPAGHKIVTRKGARKIRAHAGKSVAARKGIKKVKSTKRRIPAPLVPVTQ